MPQRLLASRSGGIPETMVDGVTGWLVDPGVARALAARVGSLIGSQESARRMREAGRRHVHEHFELGRYIDDMLADYHSA